MDATYEAYMAHIKEANPQQWAINVLDDLRAWLCKRTNCTKILGLDHPEKRFEIAEAISIMLKSELGGMVFGISDGTDGFVMSLDPVNDRHQALAEIERRISPDTVCLLVNVIKQQPDIPGESA